MTSDAGEDSVLVLLARHEDLVMIDDTPSSAPFLIG
jgi:hypothetical protein